MALREIFLSELFPLALFSFPLNYSCEAILNTPARRKYYINVIIGRILC